MLKISRLADYATTVMTILASGKTERYSAAQIARTTPLSAATVSKVLKLLNEGKLVNSERGVNGGYQLARAPQSISIADIITAVDGKPAMTECSRDANRCEHNAVCGVRENWQLINTLIFDVLDSLNLADMQKPLLKRISICKCSHCRCEKKMSNQGYLETIVNKTYEHGFITDIETDVIAPGLNEEVIRLISAKKNEPNFMLDWRLKAYRHWVTLEAPQWAHVRFNPIDYQAISYYAAPKSKRNLRA